MQVTVDVAELEALAVQHEGADQEWFGIVSDLRRRLVGLDFSVLLAYEIDPGACLHDIEMATSRLLDDVFRLENLALVLRQQLWLAAQDQPGGLGMYAAALPDAVWQRLQSQPDMPAAGATAAALGGTAEMVSGTVNIEQQIVATAQKWVGVPYLWGGGHGSVVGPRQVNVDCSGLVHEVFGENGIAISGTAATMFATGTPVANLASAQPGDLLFWGSGSNIHHVAIYIGNGQMIEAPHTGAWVHVTNVYGGDFAGIRRVLPIDAQSLSPSSAGPAG